MSDTSEALLYEVHEAILEAKAAPEAEAIVIMTEAFDRLTGMLRREDRGWVKLYGDDADSIFGLRLQDLKDWGQKIEEAIPGAPLIGAGYRRRRDFVWLGDIQYGNVPEKSQGTSGLQQFIDDPANDLHFYGLEAHHRRERRLFSQGIAFWKANESTKKIESLPLRQITDQLVDPDGLGFVWAYLREWTYRNPKTGKKTQYKRWYFTDQFKDRRVHEIFDAGSNQAIPVDQDHVIFDQHANRADGLVYGTPDGLASFIWSGIARDAIMDGISMTEALARFALKATASTKQGAQMAQLQYANANTAGGMAIVGGANGLDAMSSAGKAYEFDKLRPLIAMAATALDLQTAHLLPSDQASAPATSLDFTTRLAMETRREEHVALDTRVLKWLGMKEEPDVFFEPFDADDEIYRSIQAFMLGYQNNLYSEQEARDYLDNLFGFPNGTPPKGAKRPFGDLAAKNNSGGTALPQTASPTQGKSNGTGGQQGGNASNDIRRGK